LHLTEADVVRLAHQARFVLSPEQIERFRAQLNSVLQEIGILDEVSAHVVLADAQSEGVRMRNDISEPDALLLPLESLSEDLVMRFFTVPRVIGGHTP
jgi:aspartyl/glutamyl-tRNA(Asn/Gln) amidotransferase C subunit